MSGDVVDGERRRRLQICLALVCSVCLGCLFTVDCSRLGSCIHSSGIEIDPRDGQSTGYTEIPYAQHLASCPFQRHAEQLQLSSTADVFPSNYQMALFPGHESVLTPQHEMVKLERFPGYPPSPSMRIPFPTDFLGPWLAWTAWPK